jgi:hypothetical protein
VTALLALPVPALADAGESPLHLLAVLAEQVHEDVGRLAV